jgi:hypothetical protein
MYRRAVPGILIVVEATMIATKISPPGAAVAASAKAWFSQALI